MNTKLSVIENGNGSDVAGDVLGSGRAMTQVRTTYCTAIAVQQPRVLAKVERRLLEEARLGGDLFYYGWAAGKERIEGPSIDLAVAAARCWGNCATEMLPVQDMPDCWIFTASFIDLETGYTRTRQFRQSKKWTVHGKLDEERKDDVRFQIGQSKAERNVILKALPASLIRSAMEEAKAGVRAKIEAFIAGKGIAAAVDYLVKALGKCGAKEAAVLAKMGVADRKALDVDHLVILKGDLAAIENGQERASDLFPTPEGTEAARAEEKLSTSKAPAKPQPPLAEGEIPNEPAAPAPEDLDASDKANTEARLRKSIAAAMDAQDLEDPAGLIADNAEWLGPERTAALRQACAEKQAALTTAAAKGGKKKAVSPEF